MNAGDRTRARRIEEQVLREILDSCQRSTYTWAEEVTADGHLIPAPSASPPS